MISKEHKIGAAVIAEQNSIEQCISKQYKCMKERANLFLV